MKDKIAAFKIERRAIAVCVLDQGRPDHTEVRQLSADLERAKAAAFAFVNWVLVSFDVGMVAVETVPEEHLRRTELTRTVLETARGHGTPVWEVPKQELLQVFAIPAAVHRAQVREVVKSLWPVLNGRDGSDWILDAVALGLYIQTERSFAPAEGSQ